MEKKKTRVGSVTYRVFELRIEFAEEGNTDV
jgi:hypothetical protein